MLENDNVYCVKFSILVDLKQTPQKPIQAVSHLVAVYGIMCMLESEFWEEVKKNQTDEQA